MTKRARKSRRVKAGRPRAEGRERYVGGRIVPARSRDLGTPETQARRNRYIGKAKDGNGMKTGYDNPAETVDPIGRAWCAGLLEGQRVDGTVLRDAGRRFAALYWRKLPETGPNNNAVTGLYRNMIAGLVDELPVGVSRESLAMDADERDRVFEDALLRRIDTIDRLGQGVRRAFDQLVLDPFFDTGPPWLDRLIAAQRGRIVPSLGPLRAEDRAMLARAMLGLVALT